MFIEVMMLASSRERTGPVGVTVVGERGWKWGGWVGVTVVGEGGWKWGGWVGVTVVGEGGGMYYDTQYYTHLTTISSNHSLTSTW